MFLEDEFFYSIFGKLFSQMLTSILASPESDQIVSPDQIISPILARFKMRCMELC